MGSQCFDEDDHGNWADYWFYGTWVWTRVGHTGPGYPSTRVLTSLITIQCRVPHNTVTKNLYRLILHSYSKKRAVLECQGRVVNKNIV